MRGDIVSDFYSVFVQVISIQSPRMRGGDMQKGTVVSHEIPISIHSPRMRGDGGREEYNRVPKVSIHSPRIRGDPVINFGHDAHSFLYTPLV